MTFLWRTSNFRRAVVLLEFQRSLKLMFARPNLQKIVNDGETFGTFLELNVDLISMYYLFFSPIPFCAYKVQFCIISNLVNNKGNKFKLKG